jgi:gamma-glutamylcyclotransferase (GGCT)/AIG2-like uncharacterized protein YtfP
VTEALYFAYGSNLTSSRLLRRVPSAAARGIARVDGFVLRLDKLGTDGSAKANLHRVPHGEVWGAVYALDSAHWPDLDACERDYARIEIEVWQGDLLVPVQTYRSDRLTADPVPFAWYTQLMLDGAREHGLPEAWCARLAALSARAFEDSTPLP